MDKIITNPDLLHWMKIYFGDIEEAVKTIEGSLNHAIIKYLGTMPGILQAYGLEKRCGLGLLAPRYREECWIHPYPNTLEFGENECALCLRHLSKNKTRVVCVLCELVLSGHKECLNMDSAYWIWIKTGDPSEMITELRETLKWVKEKNNDKES
jgi:hypothetical protein